MKQLLIVLFFGITLSVYSQNPIIIPGAIESTDVNLLEPPTNKSL